MYRPADIGARYVFGMALQAVIDDLGGLHQRKGVGDGGLAAAGFDVRGSGSMTAFATRVRRRFLARCNALEVRIFGKIHPHIRMATFANGATHVATGRRWRYTGRRWGLRKY